MRRSMDAMTACSEGLHEANDDRLCAVHEEAERPLAGNTSKSAFVKGFGRRPEHMGVHWQGAGVGKPPGKETAGHRSGGGMAGRYGDLAAAPGVEWRCGERGLW